jgi:CelD/BcsL family acetyltransferase involved in cellulose biosynthesis
LAFLATPVIDAGCVMQVLAAMLEAIAANRALPNFVMLSEMGDGGPVMTALCNALNARNSDPVFFRRIQRPALRTSLDGKAYFAQSISAGSRNKLRRRRRKLASDGAVATTTHTRPEDVRPALEEFLTLEASGWKGQRGTAILCDQAQTKFTRDFVEALAADGLVTIQALRLDGRAVAARVVLRSGAGAFTWKSTYDEAFRDYSPGVLLLEDFMNAVLSERNVAFVDSCNFGDDGYVADFWMERQPIADLLFDARRGRSLAFVMAAASERVYRRSRDTAKTAYLRFNPWVRRIASSFGTRPA